MVTINPADDKKLAEFAKLFGTKAIYGHESFDASFQVYSNDVVDKFVRKHKGLYLVSSTGTLFMADSDANRATSIINYIAKQFKISANEVRVIPVAYSLLSSVYKGYYESDEMTEDENTDKFARSDTQLQLDSIIGAGVAKGATDIHIKIMGRNSAYVKMRVSGMLREYKNSSNASGRWSPQELKNICAAAINGDAAESRGTSEGFNTNQPQDASFDSITASHRKKIRYSHVPNVQGGITAVLRILASSEESNSKKKDLTSLGYMPDQIQLIEQVSVSSHGLVLVTGPTGSGKSTTLHACLALIPESKAIYTYEDPVESVMLSATQVPVTDDSDSKLNYENLSKNTLRLDPDVIMYGELRTHAVAEQTVHAATTGHLVFSTLHTQSAVGAVTRLNDLGIELARLAEPGFLRLVIFQRLLPKTCEACSFTIDNFNPMPGYKHRQFERIRKYFNDASSSLKIANTQPDNQCEKCEGCGYAGVVLTAEVVAIDFSAREFILKNDINAWLNSIKKSGWMSVKGHAEQHVRAGTLCPITAEMELSEGFGSKVSDESFNYAEYRQSVTNSLPSIALNDEALV